MEPMTMAVSDKLDVSKVVKAMNNAGKGHAKTRRAYSKVREMFNGQTLEDVEFKLAHTKVTDAQWRAVFAVIHDVANRPSEDQ